MTSTFAKVFFIWLGFMILLQPLLSHLDYLLDIVVKSNADYAAEKAAPDGVMTAELKQTVLDRLAAVGFDPDTVQVTSSSTIVDRGEQIDVKITAPRLPMFLYRFGSQSMPSTYYAHSYTTSEYIP